MKYAMLATKEQNYRNNIFGLVEGDSFEYPTSRTQIIEKLEQNA